LTEFAPSYSLTHNGDDAPQSYYLQVADFHEIWEPQALGTLRACPDLHRKCFIFHSSNADVS